jgi:hypothetical protein
MQECLARVILLLGRQRVELVDRFRDVSLVGERVLEDLEHRRIGLLRLSQILEDNAPTPIDDEPVELHRMIDLFSSLRSQPLSEAGKALSFAERGHREIRVRAAQLEAELHVQRLLYLLGDHVIPPR